MPLGELPALTEKTPNTRRFLKEAAWSALIAAAYFIAVRIGLLFVARPEGLASIWPPSGIALAALLLNDKSKWLRILLIIFIVNTFGNMLGGNTLWVSLGFALANSLEPALAGAVILRLCGLRPNFENTFQVLCLCTTAIVCNGLTALAGAAVPSLAFGSGFWDTWKIWVIADGLGTILITPVILTWALQPIMPPQMSWIRSAEGGILLFAMGFVPWIIFHYLSATDHAFFKVYLIFPLLIWAALRFKPRVVAALLLMFTMVVLWHTIQGCNIFGSTGLKMKENLLSAQILLSVTSLSGLFLAAIVCERRQLQTTLMENERRFRGIVEDTEAGYFFIDTRGCFQEVNQAWLNMHGYDRKEEVIGRHFSLTQTQVDVQAAHAVIDGLRAGKSIPKGEFSRRCKDGSVGYHSFTVTPVEKEGKIIGFEGFLIDTTEQKNLEAHLRQAQKIQAIGTLAGGIAHDFNNILSIILGNTELAFDDPALGNSSRFNLEEIQAAGLRARDIVRQLLHFTRMTDRSLKPINIHAVIMDALKILRASIPAGVDIRSHVTDETMTVLGDESQLTQILIHLCTNANQAMPDGGVLTINAVELILGENRSNHHGELPPGRYVHLSVGDTGHGIPPEILERIFDPYFTTRKVGEGSGMGLAIVHAIVMKSKGSISVESTVGQGTIFHILLPMAATQPLPETMVAEQKELPKGRERVLLVDDEVAIVKLGRQRLERLGYQVTAVTDPLQALELFRSTPMDFDLVITDLTMPKMNGEDLVKTILAIRPGMPIILCSGFSDRVSKERAREIGAADYLEKPNDMQLFAETVRKAIANAE